MKKMRLELRQMAGDGRDIYVYLQVVYSPMTGDREFTSALNGALKDGYSRC
jgi:hypothetical protein